MSTENPRENLLGLDYSGLVDFFAKIDEKKYRATQMIAWIHKYGFTDFGAMTNISKLLREKLVDIAIIEAPDIAFQSTSADGTIKWLMRLQDNNCVETVYIPEPGRGTLCVSSQVGCALKCSFCSTGEQGFSRNLTTAEIIGQVWLAVRQLSKNKLRHDRHVTNVVMMGMGEPLLNLDAVVSAMDIMMDDHAYGLSKFRVTVSTSGIVPAMRELSNRSVAALAVSLHAPNDELRNELVPINKKYPLADLIDVCRHYYDDKRRKITIEYVMLRGVNDHDAHARQLAKLLSGVPVKMNLIPFNSYPRTIYQCSHEDRIYQFRSILTKSGIIATTRKTRGADIDAACGQLVGKVKKRIPRSYRIKLEQIKHAKQQEPIAV